MKKLVQAAVLAASALWAGAAHATLFDIDLSLENLHSIDGVVVQAAPGTNVLPNHTESGFGGSMTFFIGDSGKFLTATVTGATALAKLHLSNNGIGVNDLGTLSGPDDQIDNHPICVDFPDYCFGNTYGVESVTFTIDDPEVPAFILVAADFNAVQGDDRFCFDVDGAGGACELDIPGGGGVYDFLTVNDNGTPGDPSDDFGENGNFSVAGMTGSAFKFYARSCEPALNPFGDHTTDCTDDYKIKSLVWELDLLAADVPEPMTLSLLGLGLLGLGAARRRRAA